ncbi:MAG: zinc-binding dehydrogenase [Chloroflexota bacterium]
MRAAQYIAPGQVELVDIPQPKPTSGQVLLRLDKLTICGSDLNALYNSPMSDFPFAPAMTGHECVGIVEESPHSDIQLGERMLIIPPKVNALAEFVAVEPEWLIPLPEGLDPADGVLGQQLGTVIYACKRLDNMLDKTVAIIGQGPVGLFFTALLSQMGAKQIIGFDIVEHRLAVSRRMGAHYTINSLNHDPLETVQNITEGQLADVVIEAVGKSETINLSHTLARPQGELMLFGTPKQPIFPFTYEAFFRKHLKTHASVYTQFEPGLRSFRLALDMIAQKRIDISHLISHHLPFKAVREGFHLAETKEDGAVKVLVDFSA